METAKPTRERMLDAALGLVAVGGVRAVTHRAVETAAGVARGSARYHFGTRDDMLAALIAHLAERDHAFVTAALAHGAPATADGRVAVLAALLDAQRADRDGALARFELYLHASRRPELTPTMAAWSQSFVDAGVALLGDAAGEDPAAVAAVAAALVDGLVLHSLTRPGVPAEAVAPALAAALGLAPPDAAKR